ncbi:MAG: DUF4363 family protein [Clostridia bacterium]|nr:DUF4363 family protein [Clostridia bacterium]
MVKTLISIFIALGVLVGASLFELYYVQKTFSLLTEVLFTLHDKTEAQTATIEDGTAVRQLWEEKKDSLQIWLPHTAIQEIDYQLYEAVGFICVRNYENALPKLEVVLGMCENVPETYSLRLKNIF